MKRNRRFRRVDPRKILPLHRIKRKRDLKLLVAAMREFGWTERRLLVEQVRPGRYQAWTGTHRLAAAKRVRMRTVPVLLIDLKKWVRRWGPIETYAVDVIDEDEEKWLALCESGDKLAANLMKLEIELNMCGTDQGFV